MFYTFSGSSKYYEKCAWLKANDIPHLKGWYFIAFVLGFLPEKLRHRLMEAFVIFGKNNAMAFKLKWA